MDHEGEAVHALEAAGIQQARLELLAGQDVEVVVLEQFVARRAGGGDDHGVEQGRVEGVTLHQRRTVDHQVHALFLEARQAFVVDGGGDDGLAGQFLQAEGVQLMHRCHHHGGVCHRLAQHVVRPVAQHRAGHRMRTDPVGDVVCAAGVEVQLVERGQQLGHAELQQRIGELQVLGHLGHRRRQLGVGQSGEEQHVGVVEVAAERGLCVAHRPLEEDVGQPRPGGQRCLGGQRAQFLGAAVELARGADMVAVAHQAEADGIGAAVPVLDQACRLGRAAVGAQALHAQGLAEKARLEIEVLGTRT
jgi:hypothetical protein